MTVEEIIIANSKDPIAALAPRAAKAALAPDTGITVLIPGARAVIRDCAMIASKYIPIMLFSKMSVDSLRGKFTKSDVNDLYNRGVECGNAEAEQLLLLMYIKAQYYNMARPNKTTNQNTDIYNDYDTYEESKNKPTVVITAITSTICEAFDAK